MKKLLGVIVLFSALSAMASDFYVDCRLPGQFTEGYNVTNKVTIDANTVQSSRSGEICVRLTRKIISKACSYNYCDTNTMVDSSEVEVCNQNLDEMKADIVEKLCKDAEATSVNDGSRPVKSERKVEPVDC